MAAIVSSLVTTSDGSSTFVAVDFETADHGHDSACAVGLVRASGTKIVKQKYFLICPPRRSFFFTPVHGITWEHVRREPTFDVLWPEISDMMLGASFIASHNASFDRRILEACCRVASVQPPEIPNVCTMKLARRVWGIHPASLSNVARYLGLPINHHHALSDAEACAEIVLAARRSGVDI
jgi:DNA polymerase III subunit epsilon